MKKVAPARKRENWRRERGEVREWEWDWVSGGSGGLGRGLLEEDIPAMDCWGWLNAMPLLKVGSVTLSKKAFAPCGTDSTALRMGNRWSCFGDYLRVEARGGWRQDPGGPGVFIAPGGRKGQLQTHRQAMNSCQLSVGIDSISPGMCFFGGT